MSKTMRLTLIAILPFACGYYLSYVFRTINAVISSAIGKELALGAAGLGLLTSAYFLTFAVAQLPLGVLLDRYGPRRVQGILMLVAASGAALFAFGHSFVILIIGRALIGLGVAAALMAGLKAIVMWVPSERVAFTNGWFIMVGALGAITATEPAEGLLEWVGWRAEFVALAAASAIVGICILILVQEPAPTGRERQNSRDGLWAVYIDPRFLRLAPLSAICIGTAWALQGLWAAPWMADVKRYDHSTVVFYLFLMGIALCAGALMLGTVADRLRRIGIPVRYLLAIMSVLLLAAELALIIRLPIPIYIPWSLIGMVGSATVISYAALAEFFPKEMAGRANGAMNVLHIGAAFAIQSLVGLIVQEWPADRAGHYPASAYGVAFGFIGTLLLSALIWFIWPAKISAPLTSAVVVEVE